VLKFKNKFGSLRVKPKYEQKSAFPSPSHLHFSGHSISSVICCIINNNNQNITAGIANSNTTISLDVIAR
jgi:hypothetical protein